MVMAAPRSPAMPESVSCGDKRQEAKSACDRNLFSYDLVEEDEFDAL